MKAPGREGLTLDRHLIAGIEESAVRVPRSSPFQPALIAIETRYQTSRRGGKLRQSTGSNLAMIKLQNICVFKQGVAIFVDEGTESLEAAARRGKSRDRAGRLL